jgi:hypothetical protein
MGESASSNHSPAAWVWVCDKATQGADFDSSEFTMQLYAFLGAVWKGFKPDSGNS